jgi:pyrroline-5-carboxylate reductase
MPNAAAAVRQSITVIEASEPPLNEETQDIITWLFEQVGRVVVLPASCMDIVTVLGGSVPAMTAALIDSLAAGAIEMGCPMKESYTIAAQAMIGAATMVVQGEHPAVVRDGCSCPGGCTAKALAVMEEGGVRGTLGSAIREGVAKAKGLGSTEA